ncbi:MAG: chemotaxis protein CheA [Desulfobulbaceae bacterium]|nr:chemotaxis protein CheA [Desulfobulbaceae bacterium]
MTMPNNLTDEQVEIIEEFICEVRDLLEQMEPAILGLESICASNESPTSEENLPVLHTIFRHFHSIKGGAAFLHFNNMVTCAHSAENLLDLHRTGALAFTSGHVDLLCKACDLLKEALQCLETNLNDEALADQARMIKEMFDRAIAGEPEPAATEAADQSGGGFPAIDLDLNPSQLINPETLHHFVSESNELIQKSEEALLQWEKTPHDPELVGQLFRNIHSLKGNCGFLGFSDMERLTHGMESVLDAAKSQLPLDQAKAAEALLGLIDILRGAMDQIAQGGDSRIEGVGLYVEMLTDLLPAEMAGGAGAPAPRLGEILVNQGVVSEEEVEEALETQNKPLGKILIESGTISEEQVNQALQAQLKQKTGAAGAPSAQVAARQDIRVDLIKLDSLINLIGEMVIAQNMLINNPDLTGLELENFNKAAQHMDKIIRELQEMAMFIRMVPVAGLFRRMTRLVHDLSRKSGKKVDLQLIGEATEVDKTVIELITDPLVHLLRNSMDHGLEGPEERSQAGKNETGTLRLSANHEEGDVLITITDDGRGLNRKKILAKAAERGIIDDDGEQMSDTEVFNLIFLPGFSTADKVTDVSGRGVGMDVVRKNLEKIKGKIELHSKGGLGTTVVLRIPLTLAIIDGMMIRVGTALYIVPLLSIRESFCPTANLITVSPDGQELAKVRDHLLPVVRLHELHRITPEYQELEKGILIVLEAQDLNFCLFVDEIMGQQQTVIKGLSEYITTLGNVGGVSGCTILGNGDVCLILDVRSLADVSLSSNAAS